MSGVVYDQELADRVREIVAREPGLTEKRMFGGLAFLLHGHMAVAAGSRGGLLLRVPPADTDALVADPRAERAVMRGREMDGWLHVDTTGLDDDGLRDWVAHGVGVVRGLPPK